MNKKILIVFAAISLSVTALAQVQTLQWRIEDMHCDHCAHKVMTALNQAPGVSDVDINIERRVATLKYDESITCPDSIKTWLNGTRYVPTAYNANDVILREKSYRIDDMHCGNCARRISSALEQNKAVDSLDFDLEKHVVYVRYDANKTSRDNIQETLNGLGFTPVTYYTQDYVAYAYYNIPENAATASTIEEAMDIEGVADANVNSKRKALAVTYVTNDITPDQLLEALKKRGIDATVPPPHECKEEQKAQ